MLNYYPYKNTIISLLYPYIIPTNPYHIPILSSLRLY